MQTSVPKTCHKRTARKTATRMVLNTSAPLAFDTITIELLLNATSIHFWIQPSHPSVDLLGVHNTYDRPLLRCRKPGNTCGLDGTSHICSDTALHVISLSESKKNTSKWKLSRSHGPPRPSHSSANTVSDVLNIEYMGLEFFKVYFSLNVNGSTLHDWSLIQQPITPAEYGADVLVSTAPPLIVHDESTGIPPLSSALENFIIFLPTIEFGSV